MDDQDIPTPILHQHIQRKDWPTVRRLMQEQPHTVSQQDAFDNTPLHVAIGYQAPEDVVLRLLRIWPQACTVHGTDDHWLPLHMAAMYGASSNILETIIRAYPEGLDDHGEGGIKGRTPRFFSTRFRHNQHLLERSTSDWKILVCRDIRKSTSDHSERNEFSINPVKRRRLCGDENMAYFNVVG